LLLDVSTLTRPALAIDFGASNTDVAALRAGALDVWSQSTAGRPTAELVQTLLLRAARQSWRPDLIAVTGGHHQALHASIEGIPVVKVAELSAIGRGGQALYTQDVAQPALPLLVVSAGSGTAMVSVRSSALAHVTGTGVGGGTLVGLGKLLLDTTDPRIIDRLAAEGNAQGADLSIKDVVSGPIGALPADATAVNFGRVARLAERPRQADLAAALVTLVGQVIATLAVNAGRAAGAEKIVVTGHLTDMDTMRRTMASVGNFFGFPLELYEQAGYATVVGALLTALAQ